MDIKIATVRDITVVEMTGQLNSNTSEDFQGKVLPLAQAGKRILLDMAGVTFMSSAGLRVLLLLYRQITENQGYVVLAGLKDEIKDIMAMTGFLEFFTICADRAAGLQLLSSG